MISQIGKNKSTGITQYGTFLRPSALATHAEVGGSGGGGSEAGIGTGAPAAGVDEPTTAGAFAD